MNLKMIIAIVVTIIVLIIFALLIFMVNRDFKEKNSFGVLDDIFKCFVRITNKMLNGKALKQKVNNDIDFKFKDIKKYMLYNHCEIVNVTIDSEYIENKILNSELKDIHYFNHIFIEKAYNIVNEDEKFKKLLYVIGVNMINANSDKIRGFVYGYNGFEYNLIYFMYMIYTQYPKIITVDNFYKTIIGYAYSNRMYCVFNLKSYIMIRNIYFGKQSLLADIDKVEFIKNNFYDVNAVKTNYYFTIAVRFHEFIKSHELIKSLRLFNTFDFTMLSDKNILMFINMFLVDQTQTIFFLLDSTKCFNKDLKTIFNASFNNKYISFNILKDICSKIDIKSIDKGGGLIHNYVEKVFSTLENVNIYKMLKNNSGETYFDRYYSFYNDFYNYVKTFDIKVENDNTILNKAFTLNKSMNAFEYEDIDSLNEEVSKIYSKCTSVAKIERNNVNSYTFDNTTGIYYIDERHMDEIPVEAILNELKDICEYAVNNIDAKFSDITKMFNEINLIEYILAYISSNNTCFNTLVGDLNRFYKTIELQQLKDIKIYLYSYCLVVSILIFSINNSEEVNNLTKYYYQHDMELPIVLYATCVMYYNDKNITISELLDIITGFSISVKKYTLLYKSSEFFGINKNGIDLKVRRDKLYKKYLIDKSTGLFNSVNADSYVEKCMNSDCVAKLESFLLTASITQIIAPFNIFNSICCSIDNYKEKYISYVSIIVGFFKYKDFLNHFYNYISSFTFTKQFFIPALVDDITYSICDNNEIFKKDINILYKFFTLLMSSTPLNKCGSVGDMYKLYKYCENHRVEDYFAISLEQFIDEYKK